ncbi:MAG: F-type H+-transporting ATPase subunit delta [Solirubrobacteraceae bacterium]|jgi:F-type H+-transporting ATPase subunit delta|nr:F-type H+-transporting ATPase subunit delta [Solirubrobacteraceae bacterium]
MEEIAQVYSRALFEAAKESNKLDEIKQQLDEVADAFDTNRELQTFFFSPYFSTEEKKDGLRRVIEGADDELINFLELLLENHRMPAIFRIRRQFDQLWQEENRLLPVQVTSAIELDEDTIRGIGDAIGRQTGRKIELHSEVNPDILGGIVLRVGNSILDASIRNRLDRLRKQVAKAA